MIDIDEFINLYNSVTDDNDSISLMELVNILNSKYMDFLSDYKTLPDLGFSKEFNIQRYSKEWLLDIENVELYLSDLKQPIYDQKDAIGLIYKNPNESGILIKNLSGIRSPKGQFREFRNLDEGVADKYLDVCSKHSDLIDAYHELRNDWVISKDGVELYTLLFDREQIGNEIVVYQKLINEVNNIILCLSISNSEAQHYIEFKIGLNENYGLVKVNKCILNSDEFVLDSDTIIHILGSIRISRSLLPKIFKQQQKTLGKRK